MSHGELSRLAGVSEDKIKHFLETGEGLSIEELEEIAYAIDYELSDNKSYVSQAGTGNVNIQIVNFGDQGEQMIEAISNLIAKNKPKIP